MDSLSGRTALLTGASRGLGRYMARALAAEGVSLALAARSEEPLRAAAGEVEQAGARAVVVPADLSDRGDVERLASRASEALGGVDVLVNNAGVTETSSFHGRDPEAIAAAVVRSIRDDDPEVIVNPMPVRPLLALTEAWPRLGEWLGRRLGLFSAFEQRVEEDGTGGRRAGAAGPP